MRLKKTHGMRKLEAWFELIDASAWTELVERLLLEHYDTAYALHTARQDEGMGAQKRFRLTPIALEGLSTPEVGKFLRRVDELELELESGESGKVVDGLGG